MESLTSPSHKIKFQREGSDLIASLHQSETALDRDFILEFESERFAYPKAIVSEHANGKRAVMVNWIPDIPIGPAQNKEGIIFILDCSGSMSGSSIKEAREALKQCVRNMKSKTPFNIIFFGSDYRLLFDGIVPCTEENREKALFFIEGVDADLGGTELMAPMNAAYAMMKEGYFNIFLLTDGEIYNVEEVMALAGRNRQRARVFSFGIGYGPSRALIEGVAKMSGGGAVFISPDESIEDKVIRQFRRLSTPKVTDISVEWGGLIVTDTPRFFPPIFTGEPLTFFGLVEKGESEEIVLTGKTDEGGIRLAAPLVNIGKDNLVPLLWAKQRIEELELGDFTTLGSRQVARKKETVGKKIEEIALDFQLMSSRTSFVAVMERKDDEKNLEIPVYVRVPIQMTRGWHGLESKDVAFSLPEPVARSEREISMRVSRSYVIEERKLPEMFSESLEREDWGPEKRERKDLISSLLDSPEKKRKLYDALKKCRGQQGEFLWDDAFFDAFPALAEDVDIFVDMTEGVEKALEKTVLMTTLAVILLERIRPLEGEKERITKMIDDANHWLKTNAPDVKVFGGLLKEEMEEVLCA